MSQDNVELAQRCFEEYNRRDIEALRSLYDPDVEPERFIEAGESVGEWRDRRMLDIRRTLRCLHMDG
jgi:ketosteroid isomerase-like protein